MKGDMGYNLVSACGWVGTLFVSKKVLVCSKWVVNYAQAL